MTNLSLSAQTVKDAVLATYSPDLPPNSIWALEQAGIAAALRAAANQVLPDLPRPTDDGTRQAAADIDYWEDCQQHKTNFLVIADELEGITYGTYRCNLEAQ